MFNALLGSIIRHFLTGIGGVLIEQGVANANDTNAIIGGVSAAAGVIASLWKNYRNKKGI